MRINIKMIVTACLLMVICASPICAQDPVVFLEETSLLTETGFGGPLCKGLIDVNGDFRDDVVRVANRDKVVVDIQSNEGEFLQTYIIDTIEGDSWTMSMGDIDNDGFNDIMSAGNYNGMKIYHSGPNPESYELMYESQTNFFAQGSNFVDMNNDGWLDIFVCDDDGHSEFFINDGSGGLVWDSTFIDMTTVPVSNNSGNYGSVWTDIDGDGDVDLYVAKCRLGVEEDTDPRRVNAMFMNENGTFVNRAAEWGVAIGEQSWTANFGDIDNDGDQDLMVINHDAPSQLFENINNQGFTEIPFFEDKTPLVSYAYESSFADFNNDGFLDILITGAGDQLLVNKGDNTFDRLTAPLGGSQTQSFSLGDVNEDGFIDVFASYRALGSGLNGEKDKLWTNLGNGNNYTAVSLVGYESNKSGIGAKVMITGEWGTQTRFIKSGVSYSISNSLTARFGIDDAQSIASMVIEWPSGIIDQYSNVDINQHFVAHEGQCLEQLTKIDIEDSRLDCLTADIELKLANPNDMGTWSTGEVANAILVTEPGLYTVNVGSTNSCDNYGQTIVIRGPETLEEPQLNIAGDVKLCQDGSAVELGLRDFSLSNWSTGEEEKVIAIEDSGVYFAINQNDCDTVPSQPLNVEIIDPNAPMPQELTFLVEGPQELIVDGLGVNWYSDEEGMDLIAQGNIFNTDVISGDTVFYFDATVDQQAPTYLGGADFNESLDLVDFSHPNVVGSLFFVVYEDCLFKSVKVNADTAGVRIIHVTHVITKDTLFSKSFDLPTGISELELDFDMEVGSYEILTDIPNNVEQFGGNNPGFSILTGDLDYPYRVAEMAAISRSKFGPNFYHYFYDWKMVPKIEECKSVISPFNLYLEPSSVNEIEAEHIQVFPNPFSNQVTIQSEKTIQKITILDVLGKQILTKKHNSNELILDLDALEDGYYMMIIHGSDFVETHRVLKSK